MRSLWLGLALAPYLAIAGADAWIHERGRKVPRAEQWAHAGLLVLFVMFAVAVFAGHPVAAVVALAGFIAVLAVDEIGFHRAIARHERRLHIASWFALAGFVAAWWWIDAA